jgi:hypothetical protein
MYGLIRRDPFRDMMTLRTAMDRLFDTAFLSERSESKGPTAASG